MVLESTGETTVKMILKMLKSLWESIITVDQMNRVSVPPTGQHKCMLMLPAQFSLFIVLLSFTDRLKTGCQKINFASSK